MKFEEIDCNEEVWDVITSLAGNGWANMENEIRTVIKTRSKKLTEDDIDSLVYEKYPTADQVTVTRITEDFDDREKNTSYFGVSIIIYNVFDQNPN